MFAVSSDDEQLIARVAALDIGKAEVVCCVRLPGPGGRRVQEVTTHSTMVGSLSDLANRLVEPPRVSCRSYAGCGAGFRAA